MVAAYKIGNFLSKGAQAMSNLVITGIIDGPLPGGLPKAIELYASADIADLSIYGVGSANNGGGSDGVEFSFPAAPAARGDSVPRRGVGAPTLGEVRA